MNSISHENKKYVNGDYILKNAPIYSKGCRSSRDLLKKKEIPNTSFIFVREKDNKWVVTDGKTVKFDKVFISKAFIKSIPELNEKQVNITDDKGIEKAPKLIKLNENEMFKDANGNIIDIETRGEREHDKIYFKVKDVAIGFNMERLKDTLTDKNTKYIENIHYKYFMLNSTHVSGSKTNKNTDAKTTINKELFLTYVGMLRILFVSENNKTSHFISWATKTLFTVQLGTTEQKDKLVSQIKGVSYENIQELFSINARSLPCVYLTAFNTVEKLRTSMNIDEKYANDSIVYKFGLTKSFESRKNGHKSEYKNIDNIDMKLVYYTYIDPLYVSEAETEIKNLLSDYKLDWNNHDEIVVIPYSLNKIVKTIYENIGMKYSGHTSEFNKQINELNIKIYELQNKELSLMKDIDNLTLLHKKEIEIYEHKLVNKDLEIDNLKKEIKMKELEMQIQKMNNIK